MNPNSTPLNKPTQTPPSPSPTQLSQELTRLAHQLDQTTRERDAARAELSQMTRERNLARAELTQSDALLSQLSDELRSDELIELNVGLWLRPSSIRDVELNKYEPTMHKLTINGDPRLTTKAHPDIIQKLMNQILPQLKIKK